MHFPDRRVLERLFTSLKISLNPKIRTPTLFFSPEKLSKEEFISKSIISTTEKEDKWM